MRKIVTRSEICEIPRRRLAADPLERTALMKGVFVSNSIISRVLGGTMHPTPSMAAWAGYELTGGRPMKDPSKFCCWHCGRNADDVPPRDRFYHQPRHQYHCFDCMFFHEDGRGLGVVKAVRG